MGPDLTVGTTRFDADLGGNHPTRDNTYNLGPTGLRGWIFDSWFVPPTCPGENAAAIDTTTGDNPWQILVTAVGTGTPASAAGILVDDVILGARAGGGTVTNFGTDARISLGWAINAAEATNGVLRLLVNRYLVATNQTRTLQLKLSNLAYSATAPYNCPKSARILADAKTIISNMSFTIGSPADSVLGLAKMAVGITNASVKTYATNMAYSTGSSSPQHTPYDSGTWDWGYNSVFLAEYFLLTGDTSVTNGIRSYAINNARATDQYGMVGHGGCENHHDGTYNGAATGYGPMHSSSLPLNMGIVLAKKCGIASPELDAAIVRYNNFLNYHVDKGLQNYGEHDTYPNNHSSNGRGAMGAMYSMLQGNQPAATEYFTRMEVGNYNGRGLGHTGCGFGYMWGGLAPNIGGTNAIAAYLAQIYWQLDLARRYDGSFTYDGTEQFGGCPGITDYWQPSYMVYNSLEPTSYHVLMFSVPSRRLYITGKNPNPTNTLSAAVVSNAIWAGMYSRLCSTYTTNQLLSHFTEWDPAVRVWAADTLVKRPGSNTLFNLLVGMTTSNDVHLRWTACHALRMLQMPAALPTYAKLMYDTDAWVRTEANQALQDANAAAANPYLTNMMTAFIKYGSTNDLEVDVTDPLRDANRRLAEAVFQYNGATAINQPTNLLYPAVAVGLAQPDSRARAAMGDYDAFSGNPTGFLNLLNWTHVQMLAPNIVRCAMQQAPADRMWGQATYGGAIGVLAKYRVEEGITLCVRYLDKCMFWGYWGDQAPTMLTNLSAKYRGSAKETVSSLEQWKPYITGPFGPAEKLAALNTAINSITNDLVTPVLTNFKNISAVSATPSAITLPATTNVTLSCFVTDKDGGIPSYTWSKTQGVGNVTFSTNSSTAASNCTASFSAPGTYVIRMACVDKSILDDTSWKWTEDPDWQDLKTATNILGAVYTNITVKVYALPFVDITNANYLATDFAQMSIGGTNNAQVVGSMRVTSVTGSTTNYAASFAATTPWSVMVSNLVGNMTNIVIVSGTNGLGAATNDTIQIFRTPVPFLKITNTPISMIILPATSNTWRIAGTNNAFVVGWMAWTNTSLPNAGGRLGPAGGNWSTNVPLRTGFNNITVSGTNYSGVVGSDTYTVCVGSPPGMKITNLVTTGLVIVPSAQATQYVAGTNNTLVGGMIWSNSMGGGARIAAVTPWNFTASLSNNAYNTLRIWGTNIVGTIFADTVTVYRGETPYVNITNANFTIPFFPVARAAIGVTNRAAVGSLSLVSIGGGVTNYTATITAAASLTVTVSNLLSGATNYVTITATNVVGMMTNDTIEIYREAEAPLAGSLLTNGLVLWLDANQITGLSDGQPVATWPDMSGNNNDATQATSGYQPLFVAAGLNSLPTVRFDDADDGMITPLNLSAPYTVFILWNCQTYDGNARRAIQGSGANNWLIGPWAGGVHHYAEGWVDDGMAVTPYQFYLSVAFNDTVTSAFHVDGTNHTGDSAPVGSPGTIALATAGTYFESLNGDIAEIIIYTNVLTTTEEEQVGSYLEAKYALTTDYQSSVSPGQILAFGPGATIDQTAKTIAWRVPYGSVITNLSPTYTVSSGTGVPGSGSANDFSSPVIYTVTDWDLYVINAYTVTVSVAPAPFVNITNDNFATGFAQTRIGGTNTPELVGGMRLTSLAGGVTNYEADIPATRAWSIMVSNLFSGAVNFVTMAGTNALGIVASDTVQIYRRPLGIVNITNVEGTFAVSKETTNQYIAGTNDVMFLSGIRWTNSMGGGGTLPNGSWNFNAPLSYGNNIITVFGTNSAGDVGYDSITAYREVQLPVMNGMIVWVKADAVDTNDTAQVRFDGTDHYVHQWYDQSFHGNNASNITDSDQPMYVAGALNTKPVLRFNGASSKMYLGDLSRYFPSGASLFVATTINNNDADYIKFGNTSFYESPGNPLTFHGNATTFNPNLPQAGSYVFELNSDSAVYNMVTNGTLVNSAAPLFNDGQGVNWAIGSMANGAAPLDGDIPELILYDHVLSSSDAAKVGRYLTDKYGMSSYTAYPPLTPDANILMFGSPSNLAVIAETNITWTLPPFTPVTNLAPVYIMSAGATCDQASGATNDFTSPVLYTVISSDGQITNVYTAEAFVRPLATNKQMLMFGPGARINGQEILWRVPYGTSLTNLSPVYTISPYATCNPASGSAGDFTTPQTYTVVAEDNSTNVYVVTASVSPESWINMNYYALAAGADTNLVGPNGGLGDTWNQDGYGPSDKSNLLTSAGAPTTVRVTCSADGIDEWPHEPQFQMLKSGQRMFGWEGTYNLMFHGLNPALKYDVYIGGYYPNEGGCQGKFTTANETESPATQYINNGGPDGNDDTWSEGTNFVRFMDLVPDANSNITIDVVGLQGNRAMVSGFQIMPVTPPLVRITNITGVITVTNATQRIVGTNNTFTLGRIVWTNSLGGNGSVPASSTGWAFNVTLSGGNNVITVRGTNALGEVSIASVTVIKAVPPFVNITNVNFTVGMNVSAVTIAGTNNTPGPVGSMRLTSVTGATTNYAAVLPAVTPWTAVVSNLVAGTTNFVTMTVTNGMGATSNDTVQIYRRPLGIVDITNIVGSINTTNATQKIAGTNNLFIVGGMIWSNSMGGGAKFAPSSTTGWTFNVTLSNAANIITVWGTNAAGDKASDTVTVAPPSTSNDILSCSFGILGNATIVGTNITITVMPLQSLTNLAPTFVISDYATMNPVSGSTNDFTTPRTYVVTSQSGSNKAYRVTVTTWPYSGSIYVLTTPQGANLPGAALETNFPILVRLNPYNFNFSQAKTNGADIRFYLPSGFVLPYQIEEWDTNSGASVWVRIPFIKGNTNQEFRMCWGLAAATNESKGNAVFNTANGFAAAMHLDGALKDEVGSITPVNAGTTVGTGIIGKGRTFVAGQGVDCGASISSFPTGDQAHSTVVWLRPTVTATAMSWGQQVNQGKVVVNVLGPPHINVECYFGPDINGTTSVTMAQWTHVAFTYTGGVSKLYVNGAIDNGGASVMDLQATAMMHLGGPFWDAYTYAGDMDEVKISGVARTPDWIKMEYENQKILQTLAGSIVQPGTNFSVSPASLTMGENTTTNFTAQAGGAIKLYWVKRQLGVDTLLAVDQASLPYNPGRVTGAQSFSIQLRAVYASGIVLTSDTPVTVNETIPDPTFTLLPSTNQWDGASVMTVKTNISNWAALLASGYTNLTYNWTIGGVAVLKTVTPGLLTLTRAQGNGLMTVYLVLDNGGAKITNTVTVPVQMPTNEAWIVRTPAADEKPVHNQFYARDDSGYGTLYYNGAQAGPSPTVFVRIYTNGGGADVLYTNIVQTIVTGTYAVTAKIPAGLIKHKVEYGTNAAVLATVTNIVCGDAYIVDGQSNAVTNPDDDEEPNPYSNTWIRSYGGLSDPDTGWGLALRSQYDPHGIGHWQMDLASNIVAVYKMPVCIINGAVGGTRIDVHLPNPANHYDTSGDGWTAGSVRNYGRILNRVAGAKLTHGIRGHFWHQGENNSGSAGPDPGYDYQFYQQYFVDMAAYLKEDFPNLKYYYVFQVYPNPCGMGPKGDQLRDVQRLLQRMFSSRMQVMSTVGVQPPVGCHTTRAGYYNFFQLISPLVKQDMYGYVPSTPITAPDVKSVYFPSTNRTAIALEFGQNVIWKNSATNLFYLNYQAGKVASGTVASNVVILQLTAPTTNTTITYVNDQAPWSEGMTNWMIYGSNGIAALTFADVSLIPQVIIPPPFVDITNANFSVGMYVTNTMIAGTNINAVGFMRLVSMTGAITNYTASIAAATPWTVVVSNLVDGATNYVTMTVTNTAGVASSDTVQIIRDRVPKPADVQTLDASRGADYGQVQLSWSNAAITVLACTNRLYSTNAADWFIMASDVSTPWTHTAASNFPSVYYRIVSGSYTSQYAVGKYDVNIAPGSIAWLSFPFGVQLGCDLLSEWFGQQLEPRDYSSFVFVSLQRQTTPGSTVENSDYYVDIATTNWVPNRTIAANAGYVLFLPQDHPAVKVTGIGMVQTNNVTMQLPYNSIPWVGLAYDVVMDMRQSGLTNMLQPPRLYSTFNYDFVDSQQTPGGPIWYAEYYRDNWGGNTINFFTSQTGADKLEPGKGYLMFFSTSRAGTGVWTCVKPY